jgi:PadR family transcriptional regulator PadR
MNSNYQKDVQTKLAKGLLDMIILQYLDHEPMHGYQIIARIRKGFGIYFGPSTIYPLLTALEKKHYLKSTWNMDTERPRKVYELTNEGQSVLSFTENSLSLICKAMTKDHKSTVQDSNFKVGSSTQDSNITIAVPENRSNSNLRR